MELTDKEIMDAMPKQFHEDLANVCRLAAYGPQVEQPGLYRVILNTGAVAFARAAIAADREANGPEKQPAGGDRVNHGSTAENPHLQWLVQKDVLARRTVYAISVDNIAEAATSEYYAPLKAALSQTFDSASEFLYALRVWVLAVEDCMREQAEQQQANNEAT